MLYLLSYAHKHFIILNNNELFVENTNNKILSNCLLHKQIKKHVFD